MLSFTHIPTQLKQDAFVDKDHTPQVITVREFTEASALVFNREFQMALQRQQPIILINVDSYGGSVYALLSMITTMRNSPVPVATYTQSKAMSSGAMLLGLGTKGYRYMAPRAKVMLHEVSSGAGGKVSELIVDTQEAQDLNNDIFRELSVHCGWNENYFFRKIHDKNHADWFLKSDEAKKIRLIDQIGSPQLVTRVWVETTIEMVNPVGF